jgi:hypothetical protein
MFFDVAISLVSISSVVDQDPLHLLPFADEKLVDLSRRTENKFLDGSTDPSVAKASQRRPLKGQDLRSTTEWLK